MFKHKASGGTRNLCGKKIAALRKNLPEKTSQRLLAEKMQIKGIDMDKTAIKRIENGERYVTDIELKAFSELFCVSADFYWNNKPMRFLMQFTRQRNTGRSRIARMPLTNGHGDYIPLIFEIITPIIANVTVGVSYDRF